VLHLPAMPLEVAEACSGIRSLMSLGTLAIVYGYFLEPRTWARIALAIAAIPIAVAANASRIVGTGLLVQYWDPDKALGFFHEFSGLVIFVVSFALLIAVHKAEQPVAPGGKNALGPSLPPDCSGDCTAARHCHLSLRSQAVGGCAGKRKTSIHAHTSRAVDRTRPGDRARHSRRPWSRGFSRPTVLQVDTRASGRPFCRVFSDATIRQHDSLAQELPSGRGLDFLNFRNPAAGQRGKNTGD